MSSKECIGRIMVVDDDRNQLNLVERWLTLASYEVQTFEDGETFLSGLSCSIPDAVLLDLNLPGLNGVATLERIKANHRHLPVIIVTASDEVELVVETMRLGAYDYLVKSIEKNKLLTVVRNAVHSNRTSTRLELLERRLERESHSRIVGRSPVMMALFNEIDRVAASDITVLVQGESGTGKELVAQAIHSASGRSSGPLVALNCSAIPENLQEAELFGSERGAYTGATQSRPGRFEQANKGTLFLDEIAELSQSVQAKLLRVLQERRFHRVGGSREIHSDFRLLAATHRDLSEEVRTGRFREDLYFRVMVYQLLVPALRLRQSDIPDLCQTFLLRYRPKEGARSNLRLSMGALDAMMAYEWPGNVRELENVIQRAVVVAQSDTIEYLDLPPAIIEQASNSTLAPALSPLSGSSLHDTPERQEPLTSTIDETFNLADLEQITIRRAYEQTGGNRSAMLELLGIGRTTLYRKLKEYGLS